MQEQGPLAASEGAWEAEARDLLSILYGRFVRMSRGVMVPVVPC